MDYGKEATRNLAENIRNLPWNNEKIAAPQKDASRYVLLYQYQYPPAPFQREFAMTKTGMKMETDELIKRR